MSNLETVKAMYAAFGRGDVPAILAQLTPDVRWESEGPSRLGFTGIHIGPEQSARFFAGLANDHTDVVFEMTEFFENDNAVAAFGRYSVTVKATGKHVSSPVGHYFAFRDGKVFHCISLANTGAFLEALEI